MFIKWSIRWASPEGTAPFFNNPNNNVSIAIWRLPNIFMQSSLQQPKSHWILMSPFHKWQNGCSKRLQDLPIQMKRCSILLIIRESKSHSVVSSSLRPHGLYSPWNSTGQNPGVGSWSLLQGIFPTQGMNSGLLHCRQILYQLSHEGSPLCHTNSLSKYEMDTTTADV